jgi:hypothetical protein
MLRHRFIAWSGDSLIAFGRALKERYEPGALPTVAELTADQRFVQIRGPFFQE